MKLNFFALSFEFEEYQIQRTSYSVEKFSELRKQYNSTHSFFRDGDFIYISNKDGGDDHALGESHQVHVHRDLKITSSLVKHVFFRTFKDRFPDRLPREFYPFRIDGKRSSNDMLSGLMSAELRQSVEYRKVIEVQLRHHVQGGQEQFGFVISTSGQWVLNATCNKMHDQGFELIGRDVLHSEIIPGIEGILAPSEDLVGNVLSITGDTALVQTNEGEQVFPLNELYLRKSKSNILDYIAHRSTDALAHQVDQAVAQYQRQQSQGLVQYSETAQIAKLLFSEKGDRGTLGPVLFHNKDGFSYTVAPEPLELGTHRRLQEPNFIFDHAATKVQATYPDKGLNNFGPYDATTFTPKSPTIVAICLKRNRGAFTSFLASLRDGMPQSRYFTKGMMKKYDLQDLLIQVEELETTSQDSYNAAIRKMMEGRKPDLALIEIPASFRQEPHASNPYYQIKAKLLSLEIPVQFITTELVGRIKDYILNSIALQMYAKMGGTPWVLPANQSVDREIVVGIGHSIIRDNAFQGAAQNRVVGITTYMSSDGQYLLGERVRDVPYDEYFTELLKNLQAAIDKLRQEQAWKRGDTVRLIFHVFKPLKNVEHDVVVKLLEHYPEFRIQYAFVTIGRNHPYRLYDPEERGVPPFNGSQEKKGAFAPMRGTMVQLDKHSCIVQMIGPFETKTVSHGVSVPMQIRLWLPEAQNENAMQHVFSDIGYIAQQVFAFTYLSWRGFLPGDQPATMLYSNLMASLLGRLRLVQGWDPDRLNYTMKRKKWFL
jgi:hypothetical protein